MHYDSTNDLWDALNLRYGQAKNNSCLCQLYKQFFDCKQNGRSLLDCFAKLDSLWGQLTTLQPLTTDISELTNQRNMLRIMKFLFSLDLAYESSQNQIISQSSLHVVNEAFYHIQNVDTMLSQSPLVSLDNVAFASTPSGLGRGRGCGLGDGSGGAEKLKIWQVKVVKKVKDMYKGEIKGLWDMRKL